MSLPLNSLSAAVLSALQNHAGLSAICNGVYAHMPARARAPYVTLGTATCRDISTMVTHRYDCGLILQIATRNRDEAEAELMLAQVCNALDRATLSVTNYRVFSVALSEAQHARDAQGKTVQAMLNVRVILERETA